MMRTVAFVLWAGGLLAAGFGVAQGTVTCVVDSGTRVLPLVELYTSEGCDSCPPADRWLSSLFPPSGNATNASVLAFHVDYWDRLGWKDRFAQPAFTTRQHAAMRANGSTFVYTPQVLLQGKDVPPGQRGRMGEMIGRAQRDPARAGIAIDATGFASGAPVRLRATLRERGAASGAQLWLVYADNGLVTDVALGENRGVRLTHDHVARALHGPYAFDASGAIEVSVPAVAPAEPGMAPALVAFVQDTRSGAVLQSLTVPLASCG